MKKIKQLIYAAALLGCAVSCAKEDRTTQIFGTVTDNDTGKPIEGLELWIQGESGILTSNATTLTSILTDKNGEYFITTTPAKDYHTLAVSNKYFLNQDFKKKYGDVNILFNQVGTNNCCPVYIGQKNQYDFKMILR
jgi:hypothetical protein